MLFITTILITNITRIVEQQWAVQQAQAARWAAQAPHDGVIDQTWTK
jgi:hypothetical protein